MLQKDDEVSVKGEVLVWGRVVEVSEGSVRVKHDDGEAEPKWYARAQLHHRKWRTHAFIGFTDDKKHDSYATPCFLEKQLNWIESELPKQFSWYAIHSDNASQHFKQVQHGFVACL